MSQERSDTPSGGDTGRTSIDESIKECRKCGRKVEWPLSHMCNAKDVSKRERRDVFDEQALRREIERVWGAHGAHAEVYAWHSIFHASDPVRR